MNFLNTYSYIINCHSRIQNLKERPKKFNLPSTRFLTVHTALGLPGSSETAISDTSKPWRKTRKVDLGPLPHKTYNWGVSSFAKSATCDDIIGEKDGISSTITKFFKGLGAKKKVSPSSKGIAELNSGSSSSSPKCAI